jgi:hypothetical protein
VSNALGAIYASAVEWPGAALSPECALGYLLRRPAQKRDLGALDTVEQTHAAAPAERREGRKAIQERSADPLERRCRISTHHQRRKAASIGGLVALSLFIVREPQMAMMPLVKTTTLSRHSRRVERAALAAALCNCRDASVQIIGTIGP